MKQRYTLVELLVVIIIIGILAGLLIPAVGSARQTAKEHACASGCMNLMQALKSFESDYQKFPVDLQKDSDSKYVPLGPGATGTLGTTEQTYKSSAIPATPPTTSNKLDATQIACYDYTMSILTGYYGGRGDATAIANFGRNKKKTRYIEPPEDYLKTGESVAGGYENGFYANTFGERYSIVFDSNGDRQMKFDIPGASQPKTIVATVGVFCKVAAYDTTADSAWSKPERIATSWGGVVAAE